MADGLPMVCAWVLRGTDFAPIRASPRMIAVRVKMASTAQIWDAAFVNKAKVLFGHFYGNSYRAFRHYPS